MSVKPPQLIYSERRQKAHPASKLYYWGPLADIVRTISHPTSLFPQPTLVMLMLALTLHIDTCMAVCDI